MKYLLISCFLLYQSTGFGKEINSHSKIKHHYVENAVKAILIKELGVNDFMSYSCAPKPVKHIWVCYVVDESKTTQDISKNLSGRAWSIEVNFIKGEYSIFKGLKK